jgi:hypothetical protein
MWKKKVINEMSLSFMDDTISYGNNKIISSQFFNP